MADDESKETDGSESKKKKSPLLLIIIILVLLLGGGAAAYFLILKKPAQTADDGAGMGGQPVQTAPQAASAAPGPTVDYPSFIVNLADPGGQRYLKITLSLELSESKKDEFLTEVTTKEPQVKDIIITVLSSKTYDEVSTTQGKTALKQEIMRRVNTVMTKGRVLNVFITEFMVQ